MTYEIKDRNIRDIRELARAVSDELSRENPKYMDSLRDHFASLAMQGMIAEGAKLDIHDEVLGLNLARVAYAIADAMLAAREQRT